VRGQVVDPRRRLRKSSVRNDLQLREFPELLISFFFFLFLTSYGALPLHPRFFSFARTSEFIRGPRDETAVPLFYGASTGGPRLDNYVIDTLNASTADYVNKQTRVANWVTRRARTHGRGEHGQITRISCKQR